MPYQKAKPFPRRMHQHRDSGPRHDPRTAHMVVGENKAQCLTCGAEVVSRVVDHPEFCHCFNLMISGGRSYRRRSWQQGRASWRELSTDLQGRPMVDLTAGGGYTPE